MIAVGAAVGGGVSVFARIRKAQRLHQLRLRLSWTTAMALFRDGQRVLDVGGDGEQEEAWTAST